MFALDNLRVLDLSRRYPGAYTAMILGDFGAEVYRVDMPVEIAPKRRSDLDEEKLAAYFAPDRNKRSIILNLRTEGGRDAFHRLVRPAGR